MTSEPPRNSFRASVLRGERPKLVLTDKARRLDSREESLEPGLVARSESRRGDHREQDRHRLSAEAATARYEGEEHRVELINLSAGGAMIRAGFTPRLWDIVELELSEGCAIDCAVRWLRDDLVGLEFAHETRIDCDPAQRARVLLDVIQRSFPDAPVELGIEPDPRPAPNDEAQQEEADLGNRGEKRHPLIWKGEIHFTNGSHAARLRNISAGGALVEVDAEYAVGSEVLLDLGPAGQFFATVSWAHGQQVGLKFNEPFDLGCLANARPDVVSPQRWLKIDFGNQAAQDSTPWHKQWSRGSLAEIREDLEGYLGR
jgi:hypothetical protein